MRPPLLALRIARIAAVVAGTLLVAVPGAQAGTPYLFGPSAVRIGATVLMTGGDLPGGFVNVTVAPESGEATQFALATNAEGRVEFNVEATVAGVYTISLGDSAGNTLASARLIVH